MFPIIWRFLLSQYLKVMLLSSTAIVVVLLLTRLDEIAHFAALDASFVIVLLFVLYQIPYILPVAIPISCLISSILLVQRLSKTHELTALRACGMGLKDFVAPIVIAGAFLAIVNFYFVSELATMSHLNINLWKTELRSLNPLFLLKNKHLMKVHGGYFDALGDSTMGESASQVVMALPNRSNGRISLLLADKMEADRSSLRSLGLNLITTIGDKDVQGFDNLLIENVDETRISADELAQLMQKKTWSVNNDHLTMPMLLSRINEEKELLKKEKNNNASNSSIESVRRNLNRAYSEILRRFSAAFAAFSFTLLGTSFGISISRRLSNKSVIYVIAIAATYLALFFAAKSVDYTLLPSALLYILPHVAIIALSITILKRISKGVERG